jgi:signal transduction histidine kinase
MKNPASRGRLFRKYVVVLLVLVGGVLMASSLVELYFSYRETQRAIVRVERAKAVAAAAGIEQFLKEVEQQVRETTRTASDDPDASQVGQGKLGFREGLGAAMAEQRELDFLRVLRNVPAVSELSHLDLAGREQLRVSRLEPDVVGSQEDFSQAPKFAEAKGGKTYWSPVYLKYESEPYVTLAVPVGKYAVEVTTAEVSLGAVLKMVSQIEVGPGGYAYVVDSRDHLVAHPDSRMLREKRDLSALVQVKSARAERSGPTAAAPVAVVADGLGGGQVLAAHAAIAPLGWLVFVERPAADAYAPLRAPIIRSAVIFLLGLVLSILASLLLARRMVAPIRVLQEGAARIGAGDLGHRIDVRTGDELEALGDELNRTAAQLEASHANLEHKVEERTRELVEANADLTEALEQQTATSEILRVISSSPTDVRPVFDTIVQNARRLCGADSAAVLTYDGELIQIESLDNADPERADALRRAYPMPADRGHASGRAVLTGRPVHIPDVLEDPDYALDAVRDVGLRSVLSVPMVRDGIPIGAITVHRWATPRPFSDKQIALLQTFADQAVIAIENVRLFKELEARNRDLTEALEQQTATSEILRVISSSPTDVQPVFNTIARSAVKLCEALFSGVYTFDGEFMRLAAHHNFSPDALKAIEALYPARPSRETAGGRAILNRMVIQVEDVLSDSEYGKALASTGGWRSTISVPMLREGKPIGSISVARAQSGRFSDKQSALLQTFADQAVIAIENVRLFKELEARNQDLTEALEQQTATSEILRVISSSPTDVRPVFDTIVQNARRLCGADSAGVLTYDGELIQIESLDNADPERADALRRAYPMPADRGHASGRAVLTGRPVHIPDVREDPVYALDALQDAGLRSLLSVPMVRDGIPIGAITVQRWVTPRPFSDKQMVLLTTFADQAVIAVENVRLFTELQARTGELGRSVDELKALGEVSQAVSSTLDLQTVLATIVARAVQLSGTAGGVIYEYDEDTQTFRLTAAHRMDEELVAVLRVAPIRLGEGATGQAAASRVPVQVPDIRDEQQYGATRVRSILVRLGYRSVLAVPLLLEQRIVGALTVWRQETGAFAPEVVNLLQTLATQSALAIQNARLFREIEEKGRQLELASKHKSQFLANMSHELRTPMNAVLGYTDLILDDIFGDVPAAIRETLERIKSNGHHLLGLINDVLDLSKIEAGQLTLSLGEYSMGEVIHAVVSAVESLAAEKKLALKATVPADLPPGRGDERRLTQVLLNLAGNAIKFTDEGEVSIQARASDGAFVISVSDTGPGISEADQRTIFEEFQQADSSSTRRKGGTGLGLSISRRIVELHGGRLWVESTPGRGSTFSFTLPVRVERQAERA